MHLRFITMLFVLLFIAAPGMAEPIKITINPLSATNTSKMLATEYLEKLIEERSSGRVQIKIIKNTESEITKTQEVLAAQQIQMVIPEIRNLQPLLPMLQIYELPFLFRDRQHLQRIVDNETGLKAFQVTPKSNLRTITIWDGAARQLLTDTVIRAPKDDLLSFLKRGRTEAEYDENRVIETSVSDITAGEAMPEQRILTLTNHSYTCSAFLVRENFWEQLPDDLKVIINGAVKDATLYNRELAEQTDREALETLRKNREIRINALSAPERKQWQQAVRQNYSKTLDQEELSLIDIIVKE